MIGCTDASIFLWFHYFGLIHLIYTNLRIYSRKSILLNFLNHQYNI